MKNRFAWWPWALAALGLAWALSSLLPRRDTGFHIREFGRLPVLLNGRVQPFDSVARNNLLQLRNKQTVHIENERSLPAMNWLLDAMLRPEQAGKLKVFRIDHPELLALLKLDPNEKHFSFEQLQPSLEEVENQARRVDQKQAAERNAFERQTMKLFQGLLLYRRLLNSLRPESLDDPAADLEAYRQAIPDGIAAVHDRQAGKDFNEENLNRLMAHLQRFEPVSRFAYPLIIPPLDPAKSRDAWENIGTSLMEAARQGEIHPAARAYATMATAYRKGDTNGFNQALANYQAWLAQALHHEVRKAKAEGLFNQFQPFYQATVLYVLAFVFACLFWVRMSENVRRAGVLLLWTALLIHTFGLVFRMVLEGRPPVTNLYSSAVFIGWGAAVLGLILERFFRVGLGTAAGAGTGFVTQIIAHNLAIGGDTMEMMRAVLDSNFWLATHVITITMGYFAAFVAGFLGVFFILLGLFTRNLAGPMVQAIGRMIYGIICFTILFSFIGTILGGIWADQSWGRFWGWDPKENGALIIVLWNAIILHARWGGLVRESGLAVMAIFGNIVTAFSWFGVNMLGVGLHSYGFMDTGFYYLMFFILTQLLLMGLGMLPANCWRSLEDTGTTVASRIRLAALALSAVILALGYLVQFQLWFCLLACLILAAFLGIAHRLACPPTDQQQPQTA